MAKRPEQIEQLTAYLDGELPPAERSEVERLIAEDASARSLLEDLKRTSEWVSALPRGRAPADLADRVTARIERQVLFGESPEPPDTGRRRFFGRGLAAAAAVVVVSTAAWLGWPELSKLRTTIVADAERRGGEQKVVSISPFVGRAGAEAGRPVADDEAPAAARKTESVGNAAWHIDVRPEGEQDVLYAGGRIEGPVPPAALVPGEEKAASEAIAKSDRLRGLSRAAVSLQGSDVGSNARGTSSGRLPTEAPFGPPRPDAFARSLPESHVTVKSADPEAVREIMATIESWMHRQGVRAGEAARASASVSREQSSPQIERRQLGRGRRLAPGFKGRQDRDESPADETVVTLVLPRSLAFALLGSLRQIAVDRNAELLLWNRGDSRHAGEGNPPAGGTARRELGETAADAERADAGTLRSGSAAPKARDLSDKPAAGAADGPAIFPPAVDETWVRMVITVGGGKAGSTPARQPTSAPTSEAAGQTTSRAASPLDAASQPTTRGSGGG